MRMTVVRRLAVAAPLAVFVLSLLSTTGSSQNYEQEYYLSRGESTYRLTLSITHSLYEYYQQKDHQLTHDSFATFVTPYSMALVGADIRSISTDDEEFVNMVLMLVHQIPYQIVDGAKYPVETIVEDQGDCDLLSYIASSLIKSQDMDVVLFYYEDEIHMNLGVNLLTPPVNARTAVSYVDHEGTQYYVAECTGSDWQNGWRIGECPPELDEATVTVVTLENSEDVAPGQVSSSFGSLESSAISLRASATFVMEGSEVTLTGQLSTPHPEGTVQLYAATGNSWLPIGTAEFDSNGRFEFSWTPTVPNRYYLKASWSGNDEYAGADSRAISLYVVPEILILAGAGIIIATITTVVILLMHRTTRPTELETMEMPLDDGYSILQ